MARLNYHHLRYFWAVAHQGNLTRAARRLNISQSALSIQIKTLEAQLGHALFERRGRQLVLTEAGRITLDQADMIFSAGDELISTLQQTGSRKVLRVGAMATLSRNFQMSFLAPLLKRTDVEFVLRSGVLGQLLAQIDSHLLDVVLADILPARDAGSHWVAHRMAEQKVSLVGRKRRRPGKESLKSLLQREAVIVPTEGSGIRTGFDALVSRLGIRPRIAAEVEDMALIRLLAREGVGLAVVPPIVVRDELDAHALVHICDLPGIRETFYAITAARRFPSPLLRDLMGSQAEIRPNQP